MYKNFRLITAWYFKTAKKFFIAAPFSSTSIIFASLISQITGMLSILLPIKVILLLGSSRTPRYFPDFFQLFERDHLIIGLSVASLVFSLVSIVSGKVATKYIRRNSKKLFRKAKKIVLYNEQDSLADTAYGSFMQNIVNGCFTVLVVTLLAYIYPLLLHAVSAYLFAVLVISLTLIKLSIFFRNMFREDLAKILKIIWNVGFYFSFSVIVIDFLVPINPPNLIFAVIGFILTRRVLGSITSTIVSVKRGYKKRNIIDSIFFSAKKKYASPNKNTGRLWELLEPAERVKWVSVIINTELGLSERVDSVEWYQTGIKNLVAVNLKTYSQEKGEYNYYFIRLYKIGKNMAAENDISLYREAKLGFLFLECLITTEVNGHSCHVFRSDKFINKESLPTETELAKKLLSYEPPKKLINYYMRAHHLLWQRLDESMILKLRIVASEEQLSFLEIFAVKLVNIKCLVRNLPKQLMFSNVGSCMNKSGEIKILTWSDWKLEPVGFGWPFKGKNLEELSTKVINELERVRPDIKAVDRNAILLSTVSSKFEKMYQKDDFNGALSLIPLLLELEGKCIPDHKDISVPSN